MAARLDGTAHPCDLTDRAQVDDLIARVEADGGPVDVVVNNAGLGTSQIIDHFDPAEIDRILETNLRAPISLSRQALPGMIERGRGHIVNVSSLAGVSPLAGLSIYASTKAGLSHFTAGLRFDLKGLPIKTTLVELGPVETELLGDANAYPASGAGFRRGRQLRLIKDTPPAVVADDIVAAVQAGRRHVRHPKRALLFPLLGEAPRRITEILLIGVKSR